jgi:hypothetical protein
MTTATHYLKPATPRPPGTAPRQPEGQPKIKFPISKRAPHPDAKLRGNMVL